MERGGGEVVVGGDFLWLQEILSGLNKVMIVIINEWLLVDE